MMASLVKTEIAGFVDTVKGLFSSRRPAPAKGARPAPPAAQPYIPAVPYSLRQQQELEKLFAQLFRKKSLITSGKLQMLGLEKVRARLGSEWLQRRTLVYGIADRVIRANLAQGDFYARYKEDTYVLIFALAGVEEGRDRANRIAAEVARQLAATGDEDLKIIQVNPLVWQTPSAKLEGKTFLETMETIAASAEMTEKALPAAAREKAEAVPQPSRVPGVFSPLWDVQRKALSAYLCGVEKPENLSALDRDLETLRAAKAELHRLHKQGGDITLVIPVRHGTLFNADSGSKYQMLYRDIPEAHRKSLVFMIVGFMEGLPQNSAFWFIPALKLTCKHVFAEVPLRAKISLAGLTNAGLDGIGVSVDPHADEVSTIGLLNAFSEQALAVGIQKTFVFNVPTLSLVTSASCMGFQFIGGPAIHAPVSAPDSLVRFRYEGLFNGKTA
jgi:hypothetical protein